MPRKSRTEPTPSWADALVLLEGLWDEPTPASPIARSHPASLQGAWMAVEGRRQAELLVSGEHLTVHFADGDIYMGRFTVGDGRPATMDVRVEEGPPHHKGLLARGIWELDGDTLRWCTASPGQPDRPADFVEDDPRHLCLVFRREHTIPPKG